MSESVHAFKDINHVRCIILLESVLTIILSMWFIVIPIVVEFISYLHKSFVPVFFRFNKYTLLIITGILITLPNISAQIGLSDDFSNERLKVISYISIMLLIIWESFKCYNVYKIYKSLNNDKLIHLSVLIAKLYGEDCGYDFIVSIGNISITRIQFYFVESILEVNDKLDNYMKCMLKAYDKSLEDKAINAKDFNKFKASMRVKKKYFDFTDIELNRYYENLYKTIDNEDRKNLKVLLKDTK